MIGRGDEEEGPVNFMYTARRHANFPLEASTHHPRHSRLAQAGDGQIISRNRMSKALSFSCEKRVMISVGKSRACTNGR